MQQLPDVFLSDTHRAPMRHCKVCNVDVYETNAPYVIEKAIKILDNQQIVTLFELCICEKCAYAMNERLSSHSKKTIQQYYIDQKISEKRTALYAENWFEKWDKKCIFTDENIQHSKEFNIVGHFFKGEILPGNPPFVIGETAIQWMQENLSAATKEELNRFRDAYLGPDDPVLKALLKDSALILV
jgi:hypothetical protein